LLLPPTVVQAVGAASAAVPTKSHAKGCLCRLRAQEKTVMV
jgi:hypothetical protein